MNKPQNIAIVSTNADKYSETFIHNHVKCLQGNVHYLVDGYLPKMYSNDRGVTFSPFINKPKTKWYFIRKKKFVSEVVLKSAIENYLIENGIDVLLCEYGPSGVEMMEIATKLSIPLVVHFHGYDAYRKDVLESYGVHYSELFMRANKVIAVSKHMFQQLQNLGCEASKLELLIYGINNTIFFKWPQIVKKYTFVSCGRFVEKKHPLGIIQSFLLVLKVIPDAKLLMIGDGELLIQVKEFVNQNQISDSVKFTGAIHQTEIAKYFNESEIFIQHSITTSQNDREGTPLAIIESAACELPCVSTYHTGISDFVIHQSTGLLVNEGDINTMADCMIELARNKLKREKMGKTAAMRVISDYSLENYISALQKILFNVAIG